jgi:hypothetical protein
MRTRLTVITILALTILVAAAGPVSTPSTASAAGNIDTGQDHCYDVDGTSIPCPEPGDPLFGQDANYITTQPGYVDNGDGTVTDLGTGLMWQQSYSGKMTWGEALAGASSFNLGDYTDWRLPTIKELYSLIDFNGLTGTAAENSIPYIDTDYFDFVYGDTSAGERMIDAQYWSNTEYVSTTMGSNPTTFGVNFADGRIKGYGRENPQGRSMTQFVRYVRGGDGYGVNQFVNNANGTITDQSTGLTWTQDDSGAFSAGSRGDGSMDWAEALAFCENLDYAGFGDWRLPDTKELQYIVDYTRSPDTTGSAAIDPLFNVTSYVDDLGQVNYPYFWTSTTHLDGRNPGDRAVYVAFGEAQGYMSMPGSSGNQQLMDVHGAGAQRSDLKTGDPSIFPTGMGPQGDVQTIYNYARCVRGGDYEIFTGGEQQRPDQPPQEAVNACTGLSQGAACSITTPQGATLSGTCAAVQNVVACVPADHR